MSYWYQRRLWVYGALAALLLLDAVVYFGWVRNPAAVADADPAQVALLEEEVAELAAEVERLEQVQVQAPQLGPQLDRFVAERFLEESTGFSRVNAELNRAARAAGVVLSRVTLDTEEVKEQPGLLRVEVLADVQGRYSNLLRYLDALERAPHLYLISQLSVGTARGGRVQVQMRIATYFRRSQT